MQPNENVRPLFDETQQKRVDDESQSDRLVAELDSANSSAKARSRNPLPKILTVIVLTALVAGGGFYASRYSVSQEQALQVLTTNLSDLENKVGGLLTSSASESSRTNASISDLRETNVEINKTLSALRTDLNDLKSTVGKNSGAIQSIEAKLEAANAAAQQSRKVAAIKATPKALEDSAPAPDPKYIFPEFVLVSIDTFASQTFAVVRSPSRGLVDLGPADSVDGWRIVEVDIPGQRVAFESQRGILRWLTTQP